MKQKNHTIIKSTIVKSSRMAGKIAHILGDSRVKGATSQFARVEKLSLNFSSSSIAIHVNLLHP